MFEVEEPGCLWEIQMHRIDARRKRFFIWRQEDRNGLVLVGRQAERLCPGDRVGGLVGIAQLVALRTEQLEQVFHRDAADRQRDLGDVDRLDDQADVLRGQEDRIRSRYDRNIRLQVIGAESQ